MMFKISCLLISLVVLTSALELGKFGADKNIDQDSKESEVSYGVDVSFPIHHAKISTNYDFLPHNTDPGNNPTPSEYKDMPIQPLGDKVKAYKEFIDGCKKFYGKRGNACLSTERDRIEMSKRQPSSMQNYTDIGFKKIRTPEKVWKLIQEFWEKNKHLKTSSPEKWPTGNTYTNHWVAPTYMLSVENINLRGGGGVLKRHIWDAAKDTIQEWTDQELTECSLYGIRVYTEGAMLATHVDRMPLVSSAIVNVAQDVDEPWPIEVYGHDGKAYNVTMEPGDMVLYESHSVLHGRPFPLKGRYFANIFIHFEPTGHSLRHNVETGGDIDVFEKYKKAIKEGKVGHEADHHGLPSYIVKGTLEEKRWRARHPDNKRSAKMKSNQTGSTAAHLAAKSGNVKDLALIVDKLGSLVNAKDENGWTPLHEGARAGHTEVVELLINKGAKLNERANDGEGASALWIAEHDNAPNHPVIALLKKFGALSIGPEL